MINQATTVCDLLARILMDGDHEGHFGLSDMAALTARALDAVSHVHNEALVNLGTCLKQALTVGDTQSP